MIAVRQATRRDFIKFYGFDLTQPWDGLVAYEGKIIRGFGGVIIYDDGPLWAFLDVSPKVKNPFIFRCVMKYFRELKIRGVGEINARCDVTIPGAGLFLHRLGFRPTDEVTDDGWRIWQCQA